MKCTLLLIASVLAPGARAQSTGEPYSLRNNFGMSVTVRPAAGDYLVSFNGQDWLGRGIVSVLAGKRWYRSANLRSYGVGVDEEGKLEYHGAKTGNAQDVSGAYDFVDLEWEFPGTGNALVTSFRLYRDEPYLIFVQKFPGGIAQYASGDWTVPSVAFPQFLPKIRQGVFSWTSQGMFDHKFGKGGAGGIAGTVDILLLSDEARNTAVLSPFQNYLAATQQSTTVATVRGIAAPILNCGIEGLTTSLPAGFEHKHILVAGKGVHDTFAKWGSALLKRAAKPIPSKYADDVMKYFVYMDDYGSYYREHGFKEDGYQAYEDVILGLEKDARRHDLRIGAYFVLDSDQIRFMEGLFEPKKELFPHGIESLHQRLGKPLQCYILWLAPQGPYRQRFPFFEADPDPTPWIKPTSTSPPNIGDLFDSLDYWRYTAQKIKSWGAASLQHDYLSHYEGHRAMMANPFRMDAYFKNMAQALKEEGLTMHYCMQLPRNVMESTENPVMVSVQGTHDHHVGMSELKQVHDDNSDASDWQHLIFTSAFYGAVGIWPSRDNIQSAADPNGFEDVLLANLAGGSMELGHKIGEANWELLKRTYREEDGLILKPDRPIVPLDRCYLDGSAVGYTQSNVGGKRWYYVLSLPAAGYLAQFSASDAGVSGTWAVYDWDRKTVSVRDAMRPNPLLREAKHQYFVLAPILENGMAVIGDTAKFITMADQRIATVESTSKSVRVGVISSRKTSPTLSGYSPARPAAMAAASGRLHEFSSLDRLQAAKSGWFWDPQTKLWQVKVDFADAAGLETRWVTIE